MWFIAYKINYIDMTMVNKIKRTPPPKIDQILVAWQKERVKPVGRDTEANMRHHAVIKKKRKKQETMEVNVKT